MDKRPLLVTSAVAVAIALAGCGQGAAGPAPSGTRSPSVTAAPGAPSPSPSTTTPPPSSVSPAPDSDTTWTGETAYAACIAFARENATAGGFDPDASTWNPYRPEAVLQDGDRWIVNLTGTVEDEEGNSYESAYSCVVAGTPAAPELSEYFDG